MIHTSNSKHIAWMMMAMVMILSSVLVVHAQEKKKKYSKKDLPAEVLSAFQKAYPKATIKGVDKEKENGTTYFEIESVDGKTKRDLLYTTEGKVSEIEESIEVSSLSAEIKTSLKKEYPKATIVKAEKVTQDSTTRYELHIKVGKKTSEVVFDLAGNILKGGKGEDEKGEKEDDDEDENE